MSELWEEKQPRRKTMMGKIGRPKEKSMIQKHALKIAFGFVWVAAACFHWHQWVFGIAAIVSSVILAIYKAAIEA